jgi:hypothetical protein
MMEGVESQGGILGILLGKNFILRTEVSDLPVREAQTEKRTYHEAVVFPEFAYPGVFERCMFHGKILLLFYYTNKFSSLYVFCFVVSRIMFLVFAESFEGTASGGSLVFC